MSADDEARLAEVAEELAARIDAAFDRWIATLVRERAEQWRDGRGDGTPAAADVAAEADEAARRARAAVVPAMRALLAADVDDQAANPLHLLRDATRFAGDALHRLGVPEVERDAFAREAFPDDVHDLVPATWADVDPSLHEPGMTWGAAKAFVFTARRRGGGRDRG